MSLPEQTPMRRVVAALAFATAAGGVALATADVHRSLSAGVSARLCLPIATLAAMSGVAAASSLSASSLSLWRSPVARLGARGAAWLFVLLVASALSWAGGVSARTVVIGVACVIALVATQRRTDRERGEGSAWVTHFAAEASAVGAVYALLAAIGAGAVGAFANALILLGLSGALAGASSAWVHARPWAVPVGVLGSLGLSVAALRSGGLTPSSLEPGGSPQIVAALALLPALASGLGAASSRTSRVAHRSG